MGHHTPSKAEWVQEAAEEGTPQKQEMRLGEMILGALGHQIPQSPLQGPRFSPATQWTWTTTTVAWDLHQELHPGWHFPGQHSHLLSSVLLVIVHHPSQKHSLCKASASRVLTCGQPRPSPLYLHPGGPTYHMSTDLPLLWFTQHSLLGMPTTTTFFWFCLSGSKSL